MTSLSRQEIDQINQYCYDTHADKWDRFPFGDLLKQKIHHYQPTRINKKALDIGSGNGNIALWLKAQGYSVTCIDPSAEMTRRCKEKGLTTLQISCQDYQTFESFDLVLAVLSLIHVPKIEVAFELTKISNWLLPEGLFVLAMIEGSSEGIDEISSCPRFFAKYSVEELRGYLNKHFEELELQKIHQGSITYLVFFLKKKALFHS